MLMMCYFFKDLFIKIKLVETTRLNLELIKIERFISGWLQQYV